MQFHSIHGSVGTVTGLQVGLMSGKVRDFLSSETLRPALKLAQHNTKWVPSGSFPGSKQARREGDNSCPSSVEVKNHRSCTFTAAKPPWRVQEQLSLLMVVIYENRV